MLQRLAQTVALSYLFFIGLSGCDGSSSPHLTSGEASDSTATHDARPSDGNSGRGGEIREASASPTPDWSVDATIPIGTDRYDVLGLGDALPAAVALGLSYAQQWPIDVSGVFIPYVTMARALDPDTTDPDLQALQELAAVGLGFSTLEGMYDWLGLPARNPSGLGAPYEVEEPEGLDASLPLGVSIVDTADGPGLTFTCMACHSGRLLGRTVIGLGNRASRANEFFTIAKDLLPILGTESFLDRLGASDDERKMFERSLMHARRIGATKPAVLGLDTSVAHISLSLALRSPDAYATPSEMYEQTPQDTPLDTLIADSKPLPWWTAKYKTRWFADGSVIGGNPLVINLLWNEIGRGTDLVALAEWLDENISVVDALTAAVFASESPQWTDFFPAETIDVAAAMRGEALFNAHCAECHGTYEKGWSGEGAETLDLKAKLATTTVNYHEQTPVYNVGTDGQRAEGQRFLSSQIERLAIYTDNEIVGHEAYGYVPPPLVGVFARYPYLHNNSVPNLCALLTPGAMRPAAFVMGPSEDPATDFDMDCVGYPTGDDIPEQWWEWPDRYFDTSIPGLSNVGHDAMLVDAAGQPIFTDAQRGDLITFLKTL